jgi:hypothetical protein
MSNKMSNKMSNIMWYSIIKISYHLDDNSSKGVSLTTIRQFFSTCSKTIANIKHSLFILQDGFSLPKYSLTDDDIDSIIKNNLFCLTAMSNKKSINSSNIYRFEIYMNYIPIDMSPQDTTDNIDNKIKSELTKIDQILLKN